MDRNLLIYLQERDEFLTKETDLLKRERDELKRQLDVKQKAYELTYRNLEDIKTVLGTIKKAEI